MDIGKARKLVVGQVVSYPADRGSPGDRARISHISEGSAVNIYGKVYLWIALQDTNPPHKSIGVWPSNRLEP